jgi:hypothetical protein
MIGVHGVESEDKQAQAHLVEFEKMKVLVVGGMPL